MSIWDLLISIYDADMEHRFLPICHTIVPADLMITFSTTGEFVNIEKIKENILIPTTALSLSRSNNIAPHPLYDNLSYIGNIPGYENRFDKYLSTIKGWVESADCPKTVKIFYAYISKGTLYDDIKDTKAYKKLKVINSEKIYIKFEIESYVYDNQEMQRAWIDYYCASLPVNGVCPVTGKDSFIPTVYPGHIRFKGDLAKLFTVKPNKLDSMPVFTPGFIPAQKICNVLSYLCQHQAYNANGIYILFFDNTLYLQNPITSRTPAHSASTVLHK